MHPRLGVLEESDVTINNIEYLMRRHLFVVLRRGLTQNLKMFGKCFVYKKMTLQTSDLALPYVVCRILKFFRVHSAF